MGAHVGHISNSTHLIASLEVKVLACIQASYTTQVSKYDKHMNTALFIDKLRCNHHTEDSGYTLKHTKYVHMALQSILNEEFGVVTTALRRHL
jgi:hypothetical protein